MFAVQVLRLVVAIAFLRLAQCANLWILSDITRRGTGWTDTDDIVCFGLLAAFVENGGKGLNVKGAVYHASHFARSGAQEDPIIDYVRKNKLFPTYEASTAGQKFSTDTCRRALEDRGSSVNRLLSAIESASSRNPLYAANWGPMTEVACAMQALDSRYYENVVVLSHWTAPSGAYNCVEDAAACRYMHQDLPKGIKFLEFGGSGQYGLVDRCMNDKARYNVYKDLVARFGTMEAKGNGKDMSDMVTVLMLNKYQDSICSHFDCNGSDQRNKVEREVCDVADFFFAVKGGRPVEEQTQDPTPGDRVVYIDDAPPAFTEWVTPYDSNDKKSVVDKAKREYKRAARKYVRSHNDARFEELFQGPQSFNDYTFSVDKFIYDGGVENGGQDNGQQQEQQNNNGMPQAYTSWVQPYSKQDRSSKVNKARKQYRKAAKQYSKQHGVAFDFLFQGSAEFNDNTFSVDSVLVTGSGRKG